MRASTRSALLLLAVAALCLLCTAVSAQIYFHETFDNLDGWVQSKHKSDYGKVANSAGSVFVDEAQEKGLQLTEDARFYAVSKKLPTPVDNAEKDFVVSFSVKNEQNLACAGSYIKVLPDMDPEDFNGDTPYWLMFGPDRCGTARLHTIFHYKGKNLLWKRTTSPPNDHLTHVYTLRVMPNNSYEVYIDQERKYNGDLEADWDFLEPKIIPDPEDKKPEDWVDAANIPDPEDKKPEDWDKEPASIVDPDATKPEDWDDAEDGEWEAPVVPNPAYRGEWRPRMIPNPAYKGPWMAREIANPAYQPDTQLYHVMAPLRYVGIDVWQVESGSIFDNIIIGDDIEEVLAVVKSTYGAMKEEEKEKRAKIEAEAAAEAAKAAEAAAANSAGEQAHADVEESDL